jgi:hypothetical protein
MTWPTSELAFRMVAIGLTDGVIGRPAFRSLEILGPIREADIALRWREMARSRLMLGTAPALRHQSAKGWLR